MTHPLAFHPGQWPDPLPIFPLRGVILLREIPLPLNIFEERYLHLVLDAMREHRIFGMIQPRQAAGEALCAVGCAARIVNYAETGDGRLLVTLQGMSRFRVVQETQGRHGYRCVIPEWSEFVADLNPPEEICLDFDALRQEMNAFLEARNVSLDWDAVADVPGALTIDYLSCHLPFTAEEKQALLEAPDHARRLRLLRGLAGMETIPSSHSAIRH